MANSIPTRTVDTPTLTQESHNEYLSKGYLETRKDPIIYRGDKGYLVELMKPLSTCNRIARLTACVCITPFSCLVSTFFCFQARDCYQPCMVNLCGVGLDGHLATHGFMKDHEGTLELRNQDFQALGYESFSHQSIRALAESEKFPTVRSQRFPQHSYITFYGPITHFSHVMILLFDQTENPGFYTVSNAQNNPCNTEELIKQAEILCGGHRPGSNVSIKTANEYTPLKTGFVFTKYGIETVKEWTVSEKIVTE